MGIPYYFYILTKKYPDIISQKLTINPDIYCMDFNGIIHPVCGELIKTNEYDENVMIEKLYEKVIMDLNNLKPKKLILCIDGVVPLAKMIQQRKRRYLSVYRNKIDNIEVKWDTNAITPGTMFMNKLNIYFKKKIRYNTSDTNIHFSGSDEYGEGEHKIFKELLKEDLNKSIVINGLDADLIILSLISHRKNIYLLRENNNEVSILNIDKLKEAIIKELIQRWDIIYEENMKNDIIESYCVMCSLLGNDFIPHILTLNLKTDGLDKLLTITGIVYKNNGLLINNNKINYNVLVELLQLLSKTENKDIYTVTEKYLKSNTSHIINNSDFYGIKKKDIVANKIYTNIGKWHQIYYKYLFNSNILIDSSVITNACSEYIYGIYWTYAYYKNHKYDNIWYYPYEYPPTLKDIANHSLGNNEPIIKDIQLKISPYEQLLIVLPIESKNLMNVDYHKYIDNIKYGLKHLYPIEYKINTYLKTHLWECSPKLPIINIYYIKKIISI